MFVDLRYFFRNLRRDWLHWGTAILILGVAVGATTTVYTLIDALVLHPLPIAELNRVVTITGLIADNLPMRDPVSWWKQAHSLEYLALDRGGEVAAQTEVWRGTASAGEISPEYFRAFGVTVFQGRDFGHEDELPAGNHVVILSHAFWKSRFDSQSIPLGSTLQLNKIPYTIIGIAPESLDGLATDLWVPRCLEPAQGLELSSGLDTTLTFRWVGRLRHGETIVQAREELMGLLYRVNAYYEGSHSNLRAGDSVGVSAFQSYFARFYGPALNALLAGAVLILLIAGADCAGFLAGRAARRTNEVAIRRAVGASQLAILRQVLIESFGLGLLSGLVGVLAAEATLWACRSLFPIYLVRLRNRELIGPKVFLGCLLLGILVGILAGWLPARRMLSEDITQVLRKDSGTLVGPRGKWLRVGLVTLQVALTFVLLMASTLMLETAGKLLGNSKGYTLDGVFAVHLSMPGARKPISTGSTPNQENQMQDQREDQAQEQKNVAPGSFSSSMTGSTADSVPLYTKETEILDAITSMGNLSGAAFTDRLPVRDPSGGNYVNGWAHNNFFLLKGAVSNDYFHVLQMRFLGGHTFSYSPAHEIVIEERMAQELWPGQNPVGRAVTLMGNGPGEARVVVGVVNNTRSLEIGDNSTPQFYLPSGFQGGSQIGWSGFLLLRCLSDCSNLTPSLLTAVKKVGADSYVDRVAPLVDYSGVATEPLWIRTYLLSFFAWMGLVLALGGVVVLSSYLSVTREHEIGVRMTLGAERTDLVLQIGREGIVSALVGLSVGATLWFSTERVLRNLLYGVTPLDPITFAAVGSLLFAATAVSSMLPALFAVLRQDPADLLRVT